tara:strand:- start:495 stop:848 length:354 start_codon:yes stop_codon:yes gene_type:complete
MALGNSNASAQSRGKNKAVVVKRRKEVVLAKDFHAISGSLITGGAPCLLHPNVVTQSYFHSAGSASGYTVGTFFFTQKRAHENYYLPNGNYKVTHNGTLYRGITIANGRIAIIENCK